MTPELLDGIDGELHASRLSDARMADWARKHGPRLIAAVRDGLSEEQRFIQLVTELAGKDANHEPTPPACPGCRA